MDKSEILKYQQDFKDSTAEDVLNWAVDYFKPLKIALASSLGAEDQILTYMLNSIDPKVGIFTLDTGRLPQETHDVIEATSRKYGFKYDILFPERSDVEEMVKEYGPNLFYESRENREKCCYVRKVAPLKKKLSGLDVWICGLRKDQSKTRTDIQKIEWDESNNLVKLNPLADWTEKDVWDYVRNNKIPYNALHDKGYPSIGCAPCTRAVKKGEDVRAGRWWWETPEHKECGLHIKKNSSENKG